jgi:hypothetical protein
MPRSTSESSHVNAARRRALLALAGAAVAPRVAASAVAPTGARFAAPADRLRTFLLMRGALDDRLVVYWLRGHYYGLVDGEMTPLFGVVSATFSRYRALRDGGYGAARGEATFYTDLDSGEVVHSVRIPYTGETIEVPSRGYPPGSVRIRPDLGFDVAEAPGVELHHEVERIVEQGGGLWITEVTRAKTPLPGGRSSLYNEVLTYHARAADVARPHAKRVPCEIAFTNTVSWRSWMKMGDRPGHLLAVGAGAYVDGVDALPAEWLRAARERRSDLLADPKAFLAPVWNTLG